MSNLEFFKACLANELKATHDIIAALPSDNLSYKPHEVSRSAYEIAEHIVAHVYDFSVILSSGKCDECLTMPFSTAAEAAQKLNEHWEKTQQMLENYDENSFNTTPVELLVEGRSILTIPRANMMWFFFFDIIHHRGQLSSYIRPMGGKNPAVYGWSADSLNG
jgi:uncharacterized damage-inducible protein DinB